MQEAEDSNRTKRKELEAEWQDPKAALDSYLEDRPPIPSFRQRNLLQVETR